MRPNDKMFSQTNDISLNSGQKEKWFNDSHAESLTEKSELRWEVPPDISNKEVEEHNRHIKQEKQTVVNFYLFLMLQAATRNNLPSVKLLHGVGSALMKPVRCLQQPGVITRDDGDALNRSAGVMWQICPTAGLKQMQVSIKSPSQQLEEREQMKYNTELGLTAWAV